MTLVTHQAVVRPFDANRDLSGLLELINADLPSGQPVCTSDMLEECLAGKCLVDDYFWNDLSPPRIIVLAQGSSLSGALCYAEMEKDQSIYLLWLHGSEIEANIVPLLDDLLSRAGNRDILAFEIASATGLGLEALPVAQRAQTHRCLVERGFDAKETWRYMIRSLNPEETFNNSFGSNVAITKKTTPKCEKFSYLKDGTEIGNLVTGVYRNQIGVIWYYEVLEEFRGLGFGQQILHHALDYLQSLKARQVILYIDHEDSDRKAATHIYEKNRFTEVSRLYSYKRPGRT